MADNTGDYYRELSHSYAVGNPPAPTKTKRQKNEKHKQSVRGVTSTAKAEPLGSRFNFYLHQADRDRLNELLSWLTKQGQPATLSKVVKACIAMAKPSDELLVAFEVGLEQDLRRKPSAT